MGEPQPDDGDIDRLLQRVQAGDRPALEELFARDRPHLRRFVEVHLDPRLRARVDPSDVVQEAQLEVFHRLDDFLERRPMSFPLWVRKTLYERMHKVRRHHLAAAQRAVAREVPLPEQSSLLLAQRLLGRDATPSQHLSRKELARAVEQALTQLPEADREVLLLRGYERLSYQEVGCLLDIEVPAARKRYGRALLRLRQVLLDRGLLESEP
jgi:RNA polymerase sigma-70 factor (ECF subfamily)